MRPYHHKTVVYGRCDACGGDYDQTMLKPLGRGHICCLCLHLAKERKRKDQRSRSQKGVTIVNKSSE